MCPDSLNPIHSLKNRRSIISSSTLIPLLPSSFLTWLQAGRFVVVVCRFGWVCWVPRHRHTPHTPATCHYLPCHHTTPFACLPLHTTTIPTPPATCLPPPSPSLFHLPAFPLPSPVGWDRMGEPMPCHPPCTRMVAFATTPFTLCPAHTALRGSTFSLLPHRATEGGSCRNVMFSSFAFRNKEWRMTLARWDKEGVLSKNSFCPPQPLLRHQKIFVK